MGTGSGMYACSDETHLPYYSTPYHLNEYSKNCLRLKKSVSQKPNQDCKNKSCLRFLLLPCAIGMICTRPECDQPGPSLCASCRLVGYCCRTCQVEDLPRHKEEDCQGHLRKIGMAHLQKAWGCDRDRNWMQSLRYSELDLVKLKRLNDRPVEALDDALRCKFNSLNFMDRNREALECAQERYCLYLTRHTHPPVIKASFDLIESCLHNNEFSDAELYARTTWETITLSRDSHIPDNKRQEITARGAYCLAWAMLELARSGDVPPEANQTVAHEAIGLARRALEIHTQLYGLEHANVAHDVSLLARSLNYFNNVDDDEVLRLYEQSNSITARVEGRLSVNVAIGANNLAITYRIRADRAREDNNLDREMVDLNLALQNYILAARIYKAVNYTDKADKSSQRAIEIEDRLRQCTTARAGTAASAATLG